MIFLGPETSRHGPATAPGPPTVDWGGTDVSEKEKKNAFLLVRLSGSLGYTITNRF